MARPTLMTHRKFGRFARQIGSAALARGILEILWDGCYEAGDDYLGTAADIEQRVGWTGEPGAVAVALVECGQPEGHGFIEPLGDSGVSAAARTYRVHDLWHHAPDYVQKRRAREIARRQRVAPKGKRRRTAPNGGQRLLTPDCQIEVDRTPAPALAPAPAPAHQQSVSSAPHAAPEPPVLTYPTRGKVKAWDLVPSQLAEWQSAYPGLDVLAECRKALAWAKANGPKTAKGTPAYLVNWLNRATNRGGASPPLPSGRAEQIRRTTVERETGGVSPWVSECIELHGGECYTESEHYAKCASRKAVPA